MPDNLERARRVLVIPARRRSTRLPDKMLLRDTGKTVLQHTHEAACRAQRADVVLIATDDAEIAAEAKRFGARVAMTSVGCPSGTDRVAEAVQAAPRAEVIVNLQGDEPEISGHALDLVVALLERDPDASMATLATPVVSEEVYRDPSCVKVVCSGAGRALYFSRSPIPHHRDGVSSRPPGQPLAYLHLGLYAYRRDFLLELATLHPSPLESAERLEQLRVLEAGRPIAVGIIDEPSVGIDTPEDYRRFVARWRAAH